MSYRGFGPPSAAMSPITGDPYSPMLGRNAQNANLQNAPSHPYASAYSPKSEALSPRPNQSVNIQSQANDSSRDGRSLARTQFLAFQNHLGFDAATIDPSSRTVAKDKLTRLSKEQFFDLRTDVYDELERRNDPDGPPFLALNTQFHPKHNQARQKLATLPQHKFDDLMSDVFYELARRYPEFLQEARSRGVEERNERSERDRNDRIDRVEPRNDRSDSRNESRNESRQERSDSRNDSRNESRNDLRDQERYMQTRSPRRVDQSPRSPRTLNHDLASPVKMAATLERNPSSVSNRFQDDMESQLKDLRADFETKEGHYKMLVSELEQKIESLKRNQVSPDQIQNLQNALQQERDANDKIAQERDMLRSEITRIQSKSPVQDTREVNRLRQEIQQLQNQNSEPSGRIQDLINDFKNLSDSYEASVVSIQDAQLREAQLLQEMNGLKKRAADAEKELTSTKGGYFSSATPSLGEIHAPSANGLLPSDVLSDIRQNIDNLLTAARSNTPSQASKSAQLILFNVQAIYKCCPPHIPSLNPTDSALYEQVRADLLHSAHNFVAATRTHTLGRGLSPIMLLDAAASHVNDNIISLVNIVGVSGKTEPGLFDRIKANVTPLVSSMTSTLAPTTSTSPNSNKAQGIVSQATLKTESPNRIPLSVPQAQKSASPSTIQSDSRSRASHDDRNGRSSGAGTSSSWAALQSDLDLNVLDNTKQALKQLLTLMRSPTPNVQGMVAQMEILQEAGVDLLDRVPAALSPFVQERGMEILHGVETDVSQLEATNNALRSKPVDMVLAQDKKALAGAAMGIAKAVRELCSLLDDS